MKLLLDTHAFIWFTADPAALPKATRTALENPANELFLSLASAWEMPIKADLGKLQLQKPPCDLVQFEIDRGSIALLAITLAHIDELAKLSSIHHDPFDRLIVAQARHDQLTIVSGDKNVRQYQVECLWD